MVSWQSVKCPSASFLPEALFSSTFPHHKAEMNVVADVGIWCLHHEKQWEALVCWWLTVACLSCRNMVRAQMRRRDDALTALDGAHDATGKEGAIFLSSLVVACAQRQSNRELMADLHPPTWSSKYSRDRRLSRIRGTIPLSELAHMAQYSQCLPQVVICVKLRNANYQALDIHKLT